MLNEEEHREEFMKAMKEELVQEEWSWEKMNMKMRVVARGAGDDFRESGEERRDMVVEHKGAGSCD